MSGFSAQPEDSEPGSGDGPGGRSRSRSGRRSRRRGGDGRRSGASKKSGRDAKGRADERVEERPTEKPQVERTAEPLHVPPRSFVYCWPSRVGAGLEWGDLRRSVIADVFARSQRQQGAALFFSRTTDRSELAERLDRTHDADDLDEVAEREADELRGLEARLGVVLDAWTDPPQGRSSGSGGAASAQAGSGEPTRGGGGAADAGAVVALSAEQDRAAVEPALARFSQWLFLQLFHKQHVSQWAPRKIPVFEPGSEEVNPSAGPTEFPVFQSDRAATTAATAAKPVAAQQRAELPPMPPPEWSLDLAEFGARLWGDIEAVEWPSAVLRHQRQTLGRSEGVEVSISLSRPFAMEYEEVDVFTQHVEAIFGATFLLMAPRHPLLPRIVDASYEDDVTRFLDRCRRGVEPLLSGVLTGGFALNPVNLEKVPIVVSRLAMTPYSDGVVLGIPAHDAEQFELARRMRLRCREVIHGAESKLDISGRHLVEPFLGDGVLTNSGPFSGQPVHVARDRITNALGRKGIARRVTRHALRRVVLSEHSVGGPPVPLVHCEICGVVPVPDAELPVLGPQLSRRALESGKQQLSEYPARTRTTEPGTAPSAEAPDGKAASKRDGSASSRDRPFLAAICPECGREAQRDGRCLRSWFSESWSALRPLLPRLLGKVPGFRPDFELPWVPPPPSEPPPEKTPPPSDDVRVPLSEDASTAGDDGASKDVELKEAEPKEAESKEAVPTEAASTDAVPNDAAPENAGQGEATGRETAAPKTGRRTSRRGRGRRPDRRRLRPFRHPRVSEHLPVAAVFAPERLGTRELIGVRAVTKFLFDRRQVPAYEPFRRFLQVGDVVFQKNFGADAAARRDRLDGRVDVSTRTSAGELGELIERFGSDAFRIAFVELGHLQRRVVHNVDRLYFAKRYLGKVRREVERRIAEGKFVSRLVLVHKHRMICEVTHRLRRFEFYHAWRAVREFVNFLTLPKLTAEEMDRASIESFLTVLAPFAPELAQDLWRQLGKEGPVSQAPWPEYSAELIEPTETDFPIFIGRRIVARTRQPTTLEPEKLESRALDHEALREHVAAGRIDRVIVVPKRCIHVVLVATSPQVPESSAGPEASTAD